MQTETYEPRLYVQTFGMDCLGNITGYRVYEGYGQQRRVVAQFCVDIYEPGSFDRARAQAEAIAFA